MNLQLKEYSTFQFYVYRFGCLKEFDYLCKLYVILVKI